MKKVLKTGSRDKIGVPGAPDYISAIKGYRCWAVHMKLEYGSVKESLNYRALGLEEAKITRFKVLSLSQADYQWQPKVVAEATCKCFNPMGLTQHACGIYAYKTYEPTRTWLNKSYLRRNSVIYASLRILGSIWLWGDVIEHREGYRAQYGYPAKFCMHGATALDKNIIHYVARRFGVRAVTKTSSL